MSVELRDYQRDGIKAAAEAYRRGIRRMVIQIPTGTGKTVKFANIIRGAIAKNRRVMVLAHRDELLGQAADKICAIDESLREHIGFVQGGRDEYTKAIVIASVQTLCRDRRIKRLKDAGIAFDIVIVDECHHAPATTYQRILEAFAGLPADPADRLAPADPAAPMLLGVTATAQRADGKDLGDTFEEIVYYRDIQSMIREGYLCDLRGIQIKLAQFDAGALRVSRGDYIDAEAGEALEDADAPEHIVKAWKRHASDRKTIVFTPTIALAQAVAAEFQEAGVAAASVSGVSMDERRAILAGFRAGHIRVVTNAAVLTEGYDQPDVGCIVIARPTRSQVLYCQMVGRGTRTYLNPETGERKKDCLIMDCVSATERLDLTTLPKMLGMGEEEGEEVEATEEVLDDEADLLITESFMEREERLVVKGRIIAKQVELFNRNDLAWQCTEPGLWVLSLQGQNICLEQRRDGKWDVVSYSGRSSRKLLAEALTQGLAMGTAEDHARRAPAYVQQFVDKNAAWRGQPASLAQAERLRKMRQSIPACATCDGDGGERIGMCTACRGTGKRDRDGRTVTCYRCNGDGRNPGNCPTCHGSGTSLSKGEASALMTQRSVAIQRRAAAR